MIIDVRASAILRLQRVGFTALQVEALADFMAESRLIRRLLGVGASAILSILGAAWAILQRLPPPHP